jgi:hypothetical protein
MAYPHLETPKLQDFFLSKAHSSLTGKYVLDAPAFNTDGFLSRYTCISSTLLNSPIWKKWAFLYLENHDFREVFLSETTKFSKGVNVLEDASSYTHGFLWRESSVLHLS